MTEFLGTVDLQTLSQHLLDLSRAQAQAVETDDWANFDRLSTEREDMQGLFDLTPSGPTPEEVLDALNQVVVIDATTAQTIRQLLAETSLAANQAQHAHAALQGYSPRSNESIAGILDTQR
ncbi:MAG: hypothetical protein ACKVVP_21800 [Chloroflexota bacterium]